MRSALLTASLCKIQLAQCISKLLWTDGRMACVQVIAAALTLKSTGLNFSSPKVFSSTPAGLICKSFLFSLLLIKSLVANNNGALLGFFFLIFILKRMSRTAEKFWRHCVSNMYVTGNLSDRGPAVAAVAFCIPCPKWWQDPSESEKALIGITSMH